MGSSWVIVPLVVNGRGLVMGGRATGRELSWVVVLLVVGGRATGCGWSCYWLWVVVLLVVGGRGTNLDDRATSLE